MSEHVQATSKHRGVAIVTGGRRGIGAATAIALASSGFSITLVDMIQDGDTSNTLSLLSETGVTANFVRADIARLEEHAAIIETANSLGPVTCLVNNAGINMPVRGDMLNTTPHVFDDLMQVNLRGTFFLTQAVAKHMIDHDDTELRRSIIVISSANATMVSPEKGVYCLSKSALSMMAKLYAARLADKGIDVFEVQPGLIRTEMNRAVWESYGRIIDAGASLTRRWGEAHEVGAAVAVLASGGLPFCTGTTVPVGGGLHVQRL